MKILTTVTELKEVELDITFPYFCKDGEGELATYLNVISENLTQSVTAFTMQDGRPYMSCILLQTSSIADKIQKGIAVSEAEFIEKFKSALNMIADANLFTTKTAA